MSGHSLLPWTTLLALALTTGCGPVEQVPICAQYVDAVQVRDANLGISTDLRSFGDDGACWANADNAELCETACAGGMAWLEGESPPTPGAG